MEIMFNTFEWSICSVMRIRRLSIRSSPSPFDAQLHNVFLCQGHTLASAGLYNLASLCETIYTGAYGELAVLCTAAVGGHEYSKDIPI